MGLKNGYPEPEDIVIIDKGILGKYAYRVTEDVLHVRLVRVDQNPYAADKLFDSFTSLKDYIESDEDIKWISLKD